MSDVVWLSTRDLAAMLGISRSRVQILVSKGMVPGAMKTSRGWRFDRELVEPWVADRRLRLHGQARARVFRARVAEGTSGRGVDLTNTEPPD